MNLIVQIPLDLIKLIYYILESIFWCLIPIKYKSKNVSGQIALITGAGGGIGRLLALRLSEKGCKIVCWDVAKQGILKSNSHGMQLVNVGFWFY